MHTSLIAGEFSKRTIESVQVNLGNRCNLSCAHCYCNASALGSRVMTETTARNIIDRLRAGEPVRVELTGGEPLLQPCFSLFIHGLADRLPLAVRTNLLSLELPAQAVCPEFLKKYRVTIIASLPAPRPYETDVQRGWGVFERSIRMLRRLNALGYGRDIPLHLVANPPAAEPAETGVQFEDSYRKMLQERYEVVFNRLQVMNNAPLGRFRSYLERLGRLESYERDLRARYDPATLDRLPCRTGIAVDYKGYVYDCDYNLAARLRIAGYEPRKFWEIDFATFRPEISMDDHCYACTAGEGGKDPQIEKICKKSCKLI